MLRTCGFSVCLEMVRSASSSGLTCTSVAIWRVKSVSSLAVSLRRVSEKSGRDGLGAPDPGSSRTT
jgi:hypothetical protein